MTRAVESITSLPESCLVGKASAPNQGGFEIEAIVLPLERIPG
jgi:hypothetical protein